MMSRDSGRLSRLGVLAPAALSACMDASVLALPAAGAIVSTVLKELSKAFMLKKWFHGPMSAKEAEVLMLEKGKNGSFLVRESKAHPGDYVLSVRVGARVSHVMIKKLHNKYDVGSGEQFDDLVGLIEHFRCYPITESSGDVLRLLQPLSGTRLRTTDIHRKLHGAQDLHELLDVEYKCDLKNEFERLQNMLDNSKIYSVYEGSKYENVLKNRYRNILPYDETRVILRKDDKGSSDYINASYISTSRFCDKSSSLQSSNESLNSVHSVTIRPEPKRRHCPLISKSLSDEALREVKKCFKMDRINRNIDFNSVSDKVYIATQGCLINTRNDFWRMLWQEDVRVVVMITNEIEKGKIKCERYWPHLGEVEKYDRLTVKSVAESNYGDFLVRELIVIDDLECSRTIYQYHFKAWSDHGAPSKPDGVLNFIQDINKRLVSVRQANDAPKQNVICVHCSAGVGRTGTFIVLDMLMDKIKTFGYNCDIDVFNTVRQVRGLRGGMVQNQAQYNFIYAALQKFVQNKPKKYCSKVYSMDV